MQIIWVWCFRNALPLIDIQLPKMFNTKAGIFTKLLLPFHVIITAFTIFTQLIGSGDYCSFFCSEYPFENVILVALGSTSCIFFSIDTLTIFLKFYTDIFFLSA